MVCWIHREGDRKSSRTSKKQGEIQGREVDSEVPSRELEEGGCHNNGGHSHFEGRGRQDARVDVEAWSAQRTWW